MNRPPSLREVRPRRSTPAVPRNARLPHFMGCTFDAATVLGSLKVLLVGCGSIAGRIALALARLQVLRLVLVDPKVFKDESHLTHDCSPDDAGRSKVSVLGRRCKDLSPATRVLTYAGPVQNLPLEALLETDVVMAATDNLAAEVAVGELCTLFSRPLLHAAVHGDSITAQVRSLGNEHAQSPCPACNFGAMEIEQWHRETRFSCDGTEQGSAVPHGAGQPTMTTASLCSLGAALATTQLLRMTLKLGVPVLDTAVEYNGFTHRTVVSPLRRNPACPCVHVPGTQVRLSSPIGSHSPRRLMELAEVAADEAGALIELDGFCYVEAGACACRQPVPVHRFLRTGEALRRTCGACGAAILPLDFHTHRALPLGVLGAHAEEPFGRLGAASVCVALIHTGTRVVVLSHKPEAPE